ncbi:sigma-54-dependent Fis family transcriptional regulator [Chitinophaga ginsengisoli]|uniref:Transcriptional regulator with GAF, ATPase, and Fis domain n=1 Tax=Chitinophaga ginsengisoli TaxID=363837 RepID=A0A2P8GHB4_9BACT|nr:sigma 54-interacting transcriptional regulator [Chitinophaga ginsengisoli]PSL33337.1 transcriptional regulator with GAF, ATPase, and Fis domain [Chitinophaga ginsengisoli]
MANGKPEKESAALDQRIRLLENERRILLELGDDITKVRDKNDLIVLFSSRLKEIFPFTHAIVSLIDHEARVYCPFLLDPNSSPIRTHPVYASLVAGHFPLDEPFIQQVIANDGPSAFILEDIMDVPGSPPFLRVNYEGGVREILMTPLKSKDQVIGFLHMYVATVNGFTDEFKNIIKGIAPQISGAVINIIRNEAISREERLNEVLLSLSNEMVKVRTRQDMLNVLNSGLREVIGFSHSMMTVMDDTEEYYRAYLADADATVRELTDFGDTLDMPTPVEDGIYDIASLYYKPLVFNMASFDIEKAPLWFKMHYEMGAREMIVKILGDNGSSKYSLMLFADKVGTFAKEAVSIIQRISGQVFTAISNISANEEILKRENEKSFLLDFSSDIAGVRSKEDLAEVLGRCLRKLKPQLGYVIRKINEDRATTTSYIFDSLNIADDDAELQEIKNTAFPIEDGLQNRVLNSEIPLFFSVNVEINRGNTTRYVHFWKRMGLRTMIGAPLRTGDTKLGILWLGIEEINIPLLQGICAQTSVAMSNIMANEELLAKEREQSFLVEFSRSIAAVRTKDELQATISEVLRRVLKVKLAMIRIIEEDGVTLSPYMYDESMFEKVSETFKLLASKNIDVNEPLTARVLATESAIVFNVEEELRQGNPGGYIKFWQEVGAKNAYGAALRVGNVNVGTFWLLVDEINLTILKGICAQISIAISNIKAIEKVLEYKHKLEMENDYLKEQIKTIYNFSEIVGNGAEMQKVYRLISQVAETNSTVLLLGETGTGKELIARAIHNASPRKSKLMVKVNCAALPAHLIESELFGHEKGAFTGAIDRRIGKFELANNSTLFLDEIGEMPLELQVKLLRVLQERELERIGGKSTIKVDVRVIAATNRDLEAEVQAGRFRSDLYYRLNVFPINLPPLRERLEDVEPLANFFLSKFSKNAGKKVNGLSSHVLQELRSYSWPGNVRELEHLIERSILLCEGHTLTEIHLPQHEGSKPMVAGAYNVTLEQIERAHIIDVLKRCSGKISGAGGAAEVLEVPGTTLHSKMKKLGISKADYFIK